jgi:heat-inducible transcriptional repressor
MTSWYSTGACLPVSAGVDIMDGNLSEREREILVEVVEQHLASGQPVASAAIARASATGLAAASIRNVMAALERKGFLRQPHTSAGRVPTDAGYRAYVDGLLGKTVLSPRAAKKLRALLGKAGALEELLARSSLVLSRVTTEVGVTLATAPSRAAVQSIHFVPVSAERVLAVVVTQGGHIESRLLAVDRAFALEELERISSYCSHGFAGLTLAEIHQRLLALMAEERGNCDNLLAGVVELGSRVAEAEPGAAAEVYVEGTDRLLDRVASGELRAVRSLLEAFVDKARLLGLLDQLLAPSGPRVLVGSDLGPAVGSSLGMIVTSFELSTGELGLVGVIGLKRMNYPQIIPIVDFLGHYLAEPRA